MDALPCSGCGRAPVANADAAGYEMLVYCDNCYDEDCNGTRSIVGHGPTLEAAREDWNSGMAEERQ